MLDFIIWLTLIVNAFTLWTIWRNVFRVRLDMNDEWLEREQKRFDEEMKK